MCGGMRGICECGCGETTLVATRTRSHLGQVKGQPLRFVNGHNARKRTDWTEVPGPLSTPCWLWNGTVNGEGYGVLRVNYKQLKAHRWVWERMCGTLPGDGLVPDHLCRQRSCVNPGHIDWVSSATNRRRGAGVSITGYQALSARLMVATTTMTRRDVAETAGITRGNLYNVIERVSWR